MDAWIHSTLDPSIEEGVRLIVAALCGALLGAEREYKGKTAGVKTNALICLGSCLLMILSIEMSAMAGVAGDPGRIAAQVVSGIGFLGAGAIIQAKKVVLGLTTAATIWAVAAIGLTLGAGYYQFGLAVSLMVLFILFGASRIEDYMSRVGYHNCRILLVMRGTDLQSDAIDRILNAYHIHFTFKEVKLDHPRMSFEFGSRIPARKFDRLMKDLAALEGLENLHALED